VARSTAPTGLELPGRSLIAVMAERRQKSDADDQRIGVARALPPEGSRNKVRSSMFVPVGASGATAAAGRLERRATMR
jgi:hypothetical protein